MSDAQTSPHPLLEAIFACNDQSALLHNFITSENPPPGAWSRHASPQSALGKVSFPLVLTVARGELYTRTEMGVINEEMMDRQHWLPWAYDCANDRVSVERSVGPDVFHAHFRYACPAEALLLIELVPAGDIPLTINFTPWGAQFRWENHFDVDLRFAGDNLQTLISDDPASLRRRFAGFGDVPINPGHLNWVWNFMRRCWIGVEFQGELELVLAVNRPGKVVSTGIDGQTLRRAEQERWQAFFDTQTPSLITTDPVLRDTYYFAWQMVWSNRCTGGSAELPHSFTSPARLFYGAQWWWDECFTAVILRHLADPSICYEFLENFREAQNENGMIPGYLNFTEHQAKPRIIMQPVIIGCVLRRMREHPGWPEDLQPLYTMLHRHALWQSSPDRDTDGDGLSEYFHCDDSGQDQCSRWDAQKVNPADVVGPIRPTETVDHNVWISVLWDVLGDMADDLGDSQAATEHRGRSRRIMELVEEFMWDEQDGIYYDIDAYSHRKLKVKSPAAFMPMLSPHARKDRVERLIHQHLTNPTEFLCNWPLCSVSLDDPTFDEADMWRGPTWVCLNWLVIEGLDRQRYTGIARDLARTTIEMVGSRYTEGKRTRTPRLWEWYNPITGDPLGNSQYTWSGLVIDLILRYFN